MKDREIKSTIITLFLTSIFLFALIYFIHAKNVERRFDKILENYTNHLQSIITNNTNTVINLDTKILESSMAKIMKNSNDVLSFWFAFLSVIMIVFTFAGIFINNNNLGLYKEAIEDFNKAIELNPNNSNSYNFRGNAKYNLKLYKEAIKDYDKAIELNPHYSNTYSNIGLNKINLVLYEEDIELNTNYSKYYFNKALSKQLLANNTENKEEYNKLIEEAYNDFIKSYNLFGDKLKDEYKQKIINLARQSYEAAIKICDEKGWEY